jgi:hypothetical protein
MQKPTGWWVLLAVWGWSLGVIVLHDLKVIKVDEPTPPDALRVPNGHLAELGIGRCISSNFLGKALCLLKIIGLKDIVVPSERRIKDNPETSLGRLINLEDTEDEGIDVQLLHNIRFLGEENHLLACVPQIYTRIHT